MSEMLPIIPELLGTFEIGNFSSYLLGHPRTSLVVPALLGTFGTGIFSSRCGISRDVPSSPRILGTFGTGIFSSHLVGYPGTSLVVPDFLGPLGPGFLALTLWDILGCP